jgi:hypothetical protein
MKLKIKDIIRENKAKLRKAKSTGLVMFKGDFTKSLTYASALKRIARIPKYVKKKNEVFKPIRLRTLKGGHLRYAILVKKKR